MDPQSRERSLAADREWVLEAVPRVSRTFALSIDLLEEPVASWVATGYLLCRTADTVEDDPDLPMTRRAALLETLDGTLAGDVPSRAFLEGVRSARPEPDSPDWTVAHRTDRTLRVLQSFDPPIRRATRGAAREMATGMADVLRRHADSGGLRIRTVEELEEYCEYVAGTVGAMFTDVLEWHGDGVDPDPADARSFALLLQLVNVATDVGGDWATENNVYLPGTWLAEAGLDHAAVGDPANVEAVADVVERVVEHATQHAPGARRYLRQVPDHGGLRQAAALPYLLALATARQLRSEPASAVRGPEPVKISRAEVEALFERVAAGVTGADLDDLAAVVRADPYLG